MRKALMMAGVVLAVLSATAQTKVKSVRIEKLDGTRIVIPVSEIEDITVEDVSRDEEVLAVYRRFAGDWYLVASPYDGGVVSIPFTATLPPVESEDYGRVLYCHSDELLVTGGEKIAADWQLAFSYNTLTDKGQIGIVLSEQEPVGTRGSSYLYLLSENIDKAQLEGMTLWNSFARSSSDEYMQEHEFVFPASNFIYVVQATGKPYQAKDVETYLDILASPRIQRSAYVSTAN